MTDASRLVNDADVISHIREEYSGVFSERQLQRHVATHLGREEARDQVALVRRLSPDAGTVLDVGCGYGAFVAEAAESGQRAFGVDIAGYELAVARDRLASIAGGAVVHGDAAHLPIRDGAIDVVTMWNAVEHVEDIEAALRAAHRVLRRGGQLVVLAPNYAAIRSEAHYHVPWAPFLRGELAVRWLRLFRRDPTFWQHHVHPRSLRSIDRALRQAGFETSSFVPDKLRRPAEIKSMRLRIVATAIHRVGLATIAERVLALTARNPLQGTIRLVATRR